jgi:hypothetical protein
MEYIKSPFAGSKVQIPKKNCIRVETYEENTRYKEEFEYNVERGDCDANNHYLQLIHKEREEYLLVRLQ